MYTKYKVIMQVFSTLIKRFFPIKLTRQNAGFPVALISICLLISWLNFTPGTWQTGWDTLHPEFNFSVNIHRHMFGMWQENQGLGNVGGHSHAADTSRILVMFVLSLLFPVHVLRYVYLFLTLIMGPLGMYFFLKDVIFRGISNDFKRQTVAFLGALFYLFNLGTVQQYIVQLEMYTVLYGGITWYFWAAGKCLYEGKAKNFLILAIVTILAAPMAYAITVFVSMYLILFVFLTITAVFLFLQRAPSPVKQEGSLDQSTSFVTSSQRKVIVKRWFLINLVVMIMNSYWLLPSLYFGLKHAGFVSISNINEHFSSRIFAYNAAHGSLSDLLLLKGFLVDWRNYDFVTGGYYKIMVAWNNYFDGNTPVLMLSFFFITLGIFGGAHMLYRKNKNLPGLAAGLFICVFMYLTSNLPFGELFLFLKDKMGPLGEMFRNPYTKFSVQLILLYSTFFAAGAYAFVNVLESIKYSGEKVLKFVAVAAFVLMSFVMLPMYTGELINKDIRMPIPNDYFKLYDWLNAQTDSRRIATLPIHSFWGWTYYKWKYQGAGFIWFGMKQPVLDRDFDRWNPYNEEYFYEMSRAVYSGDIAALDETIKKYGIGYILLDENVISTDQAPDVTYITELKKLLPKSALLKEKISFGAIHVYKNTDGATVPFYTLSKDVSSIIDYPFQTGRKAVAGKGRSLSPDLTITGNYDLVKNDYVLNMPDISKYESRIFTKFRIVKKEANYVAVLTPVLPKITLNAELILDGDKMSKEITLGPVSAFPDGIFLAVNDGQPFDFSKETTQGEGYLNLTADNSINVYSHNASASFNMLSSLATNQICSDGPDSKVSIAEDSIYVLSGENLGCVAFSFDVPIGNYLFTTNFSYTTDIQSTPGYCLEIDQKCQSSPLFRSAALNKELRILSDNISGDSTGKVTLKLFAPLNLEKQISHIQYREASVLAYPRSLQLTLTKDDIAAWLNEITKPISLSQISQLTISATMPKGTLYSYSLAGKALYDASQFDEVENGSRQKSFSDGIKLYTADANLYDSLEVPLFNDLSYLAIFNVKNVKGYPLTVSVEDIKSGRYFLYKKIEAPISVYDLQNGDPEKVGEGYRVGFTNFSIGKDVSENVIKSIEFIPYNGNWLSNITLNSVGAVKDNVEKAVDYKNETKFATFLYKVSGLTPGENLVFETSYEDGWHAFGGASHNTAKGWANSWLVTSPNVYIVFLPGLVQVAGYVAAAGLLGILVIAVRRSKTL